MKTKLVSPALISVLALALNGCIRNDAPMHFYMLDAGSGIHEEVKPLPANSQITIGLGPIRIPEYLNRPQMVIAVSSNQYRLDEHHRWAERLDQNISRALSQFLARQLGDAHIVRHPWPQRQNIDYQAIIDVLQFHQDNDGQSRLTAQWTLKNQKQTTIVRRFNCALPAASGDYEAIVNAQSECLSRLGMDITGALQRMLHIENKQK